MEIAEWYMTPLPDLERVARYRQSIGDAWRHGDANAWPVKLNAAVHLFVKEFGEELLDDLRAAEADGLSLERVAAPFYNPSRLYRIIDFTVYSMRRNRYSLEAQRRIVVKLLTMTRALKYGSEFNEDDRNTILNPEQSERAAAMYLQGEQASLRQSQLVHRFCATMWAYTECIFFRAHDVTKEIHGPYPLEDDDHFLVQEYLNLRPDRLWPGIPLLSCKTIKVYKQYPRAVAFRIDPLNHLYPQGPPLVPNLKRFGVEVDGEEATLDVLNDFLRTMEETIRAICSRIEASSWNDRVAKYAEIFWFRKKPLADLRGRAWGVPARVYDAIRRGQENQFRKLPLSDEASERLAMLTI